VAGSCKQSNESSGSLKSLDILEKLLTVGFSRKIQLHRVCYFVSEDRFRAGTEGGVWSPAREVTGKLQSQICRLQSLLFSVPSFELKQISK
jgi:hypothetical protein